MGLRRKLWDWFPGRALGRRPWSRPRPEPRTLVLAAAAHAHDRLDHLDHPCLPEQAPANDPFVPLPDGALRTHSERSPPQHPPEQPPLPACALPSAWQPVQQLPISLPPAVLPGHSLSVPLRPVKELLRTLPDPPMSEHAHRRAAHDAVPHQPCIVPLISLPLRPICPPCHWPLKSACPRSPVLHRLVHRS